ncbi:3-isopropylmalate dehydratase small subunit [Psychrosphaera sp. B3R10]|uniref:3-isopropylmalate dehydratase small subunit n=1 Tax=unclassified Psychrosphaera TaxID=2641570 RepID=UPI001C08C1DF|nr:MULTISPECIES: 3-isopropylmalate dehydratase small subunit [unclassified Psychrosphaera]MBU2883358.1 3-isopropylmalate dehydratase small subunit [Psychrosphaera sp. I2R16]MBU2990548.1 3-isopropylmalate dehydratase small subunit [Psychrosphaera sp. B3R10]MDO6718978.1 3-isopropylmalate dehydratase small subunit [Psychrosphaera sp. 1_MG-2023]
MTEAVFHQGIVCPLDKNNVDTDQIIPKQFLTSVERDGFDKALFFDWRYLDNGEPNPEFVLNFPQYQGASVLLTRENFGCGSSREHAPWALKQYGFQVVIAPSFADIFYNNCINNQIVPAKISNAQIDALFDLGQSGEPFELKVDLKNQQLLVDGQAAIDFEIAEDVRERLLKNLDFIGVTEEFNDQISAFEQNLEAQRAWQ